MGLLNHEFVDLLKAIIRHPGVVGAEHSFFRILQRELEECGHWDYHYAAIMFEGRGRTP